MCGIELSEIEIIPIKPQGGLTAFASCVLNHQFHIANIAIYSSPGSPQGFRLVFPNKKLASGQTVNCFYPIDKKTGDYVTSIIIKKYLELMDHFVA